MTALARSFSSLAADLDRVVCDLDNVVYDLDNDEGGQSTVEYMLLISVIVIALVAAAYVFVPLFRQGVQDLGQDVKKILSTGKISDKGYH